ncbi:GNAT family N-acetyltransferase [Streptomyces sp. LP05-1]|uniref:GNAT family N-acetyltransferase n=1 Tax=Streptomyces pyxinae TaxID=2970734 RepID=A0ABT2CG21_9ACTN|nr:GNAT family N-acetyltransferase [Streptomyces sp. LP05-1]MCS0636367.1 GNAT family N-acetyltransferase [Streptomyces sp. LP05-1]
MPRPPAGTDGGEPAGALVIGRAAPADWAVVTGWAADEGWNPGRSDAGAFFAQDPDGFFLGRLAGEPVSAVSVVRYDSGYAFLGCYLVRPDLRGHGLGLATWTAGLAHAGGRVVGLDGVPGQQGNYRRSGFRLAHRSARFTGSPVPVTESPAGVVPLTGPDGAAAAAAYDRGCFPAGRRRFLDAWLTAEGHHALGRVVDGRLTGYGVIRPARDGSRIGPLFADTAEDAAALFDALVAAPERPPGPVAVDVPLSHPAAVALAGARGLTPGFETARMYTGPARPVATERIFGITTLELG